MYQVLRIVSSPPTDIFAFGPWFVVKLVTIVHINAWWIDSSGASPSIRRGVCGGVIIVWNSFGTIVGKPHVCDWSWGQHQVRWLLRQHLLFDFFGSSSSRRLAQQLVAATLVLILLQALSAAPAAAA